jgi:hypothetical protein
MGKVAAKRPDGARALRIRVSLGRLNDSVAATPHPLASLGTFPVEGKDVLIGAIE